MNSFFLGTTQEEFILGVEGIREEGFSVLHLFWYSHVVFLVFFWFLYHWRLFGFFFGSWVFLGFACMLVRFALYVCLLGSLWKGGLSEWNGGDGRVLVILEADRVVEKKLRERAQTQKQNKIAFWRALMNQKKHSVFCSFIVRDFDWPLALRRGGIEKSRRRKRRRNRDTVQGIDWMRRRRRRRREECLWSGINWGVSTN
jgi:hypothetical protein